MGSLSSEKLLAIIETQSEIAATALELDAIKALVVERASSLTGAAAGVIEIVDGGEMVVEVASGAARPYLGTRLRADSCLSGLCVARGEILHCEDTAADDRVDREACERVGAGSLLCVPLRTADAVVGVLEVYAPQPYAFADDDVQVLSLLSGVVAAHMARSDEQELQLYDALTGLPNRLAFEERVAAEAARTRRHGGEVALCLLDLDGLGRLNDTPGDATADEALRAVARHLDGIRGEDAAYRISANEFALILVGADEAGAGLAAERIRSAVRADPGCRGIGVSIGIAFLGGDPLAALALADAKLYAAKALRR